VISSQPNAGAAATVWQHVFTLQDLAVSLQLPVTTLIEIMGTAHNVMRPSMLLKMMEMTGDGRARISSTTQFHGSGKEIVPSGLSFAQVQSRLPVDQHYFMNSQAKVVVADSVSLANAVDYGASLGLNSWGWSVNNNPLTDDGYRPGSDTWQTTGDPDSGQIRAEMLTGKQEVSATQVVRLRDQTERNLLKSRKKLDWQLDLVGGTITGIYKRRLTVRMPEVRYDSLDIPGGSPLAQNIRMKSFGDAPITFTLINEVPSYTELPA